MKINFQMGSGLVSCISPSLNAGQTRQTVRKYKIQDLTPFMVALGVLFLAGCSAPKSPSTESTPVQMPAAAPREVTTSSGIAMIHVPGGHFMMGSENGVKDEAPRHEVALSAFLMDKYEVTQEQYAALELPDPSHFKNPKRPVEQVRWSDAALFCNERSRAEGLEPCYDEVTFACNFAASGYRLPTEAEWEYAARAGSETAYDFGDRPDKLRGHACYAATSSKKTDLVGKRKPNAWGFHDLSGNVVEWCHDVYSATYYAASPDTDPRGPEAGGEGEKRVMRGGAWNTSADGCRVAIRYGEIPGITDACFARDTFGFRCVKRAPAE